MRWPALAPLVLAACSSRVTLPELPQVQLDRFLPAVRQEVSAAVDRARRSPEDPEANGRLGMVLHAYEQFAAAKVCYERARILAPQTYEWSYYLAAVESSLGNPEAALEALRNAAKIDPAYVPAQLRMAETLFDLGRLDESGRIYDRLVGEHPESAAAWYGQGRVRATLGDTERAAASLRKACELFPEYGSAQYALAQALRKLGQSAEADRRLILYEKNKTTVPNLNDARMAEVRRLNVGIAHLLQQATELERQGRLEEAVALHLRGLEADPKSVQAHTNLITLYARLGQPEKAAAHYRTAVELNPNQADTHYNYGVLLFEQKKFVEARKAFGRALEINPYYAEAHNNLGYLLEMEGRTGEAVAHYRKAIENQPGYRLAHFHLGRILVNQRNYAEAIAHLEKTLTPEDQSTPGYLYALGAAYGRSGDRARSIEFLRKAREQASALGQTQLVASIDRDLQVLERPGARR